MWFLNQRNQKNTFFFQANPTMSTIANSTMTTHWRPRQQQEQRRVGGATGWNLPGVAGDAPTSRTRNGGRRVTRRLSSPSLSSSDDEWIDEGVSSSSQSSDGEVQVIEEKRPTTRAIVEISTVTSFMEKHTFCPNCNCGVEVDLLTGNKYGNCLASSLKIACLNEDCGYINYSARPAPADVPCCDDNRERTTDYAINVLYVLGFMACGDGGKEAARLCGFLGLSGSTWMETRSFPVIEERIGAVIRDLTDDILVENLIEEVRQSIESSSELNENDFLLWKMSLTNKTIHIPDEKKPKLMVSSDMGWQQTGFNSPSGHSMYVGAQQRKALIMEIKSKLCGVCDHFHRNGTMQGPVRDHDCFKNWFGSSKAMEARSCLDMLVRLYRDCNVILDVIVADDDSSTRSMLSWSNADYMRNNNLNKPPQVPITKGKNKGKMQDRPEGYGQLPGDVPQPRFVSDPNHRKKILTGELRALATLKVADKMTMTKMDAIRIGKNFGYMIRGLGDRPKEKHVDDAKAVLEHHFDEHKRCGNWCLRKKQTAAQKLQTNQHYRSKTKDLLLYEKVKVIVERFITAEALAEVSHGMDTQMNESLNNTISWFAPKNKVFCSTGSLHNRLSMAVGINSLGFLAYYRRLLSRLGISVTPDIMHFLTVKDRERSKRLEKLKASKQKKRRMKGKIDALRNETTIAVKERARREGTYRRGMNIAAGSSGGFTAEEIEDANNKKKKKSTKNVICPHCGKTGHSRRSSKDCDQHVPPKKKRQGSARKDNDLGLDAKEAQGLEELPLDDESLAEFHDAGTWTSDDNDDDDGSVIDLGII